VRSSFAGEIESGYDSNLYWYERLYSAEWEDRYSAVQ
jgi:hypothetical protein